MDSNQGILRKSGDQGITDLFSGESISKSSLRLDVLGDMDELQGLLGIARYQAHKRKTKQAILEIQKDLFTVGAELATSQEKLSTLAKRVDKNFMESLEKKTLSLYEEGALPKNFIIPGDQLSAAQINYARTVARRCERKIVKLFENKEISNERILMWFNRLSVYLYLLSLRESS